MYPSCVHHHPACLSVCTVCSISLYTCACRPYHVDCGLTNVRLDTLHSTVFHMVHMLRAKIVNLREAYSGGGRGDHKPIPEFGSGGFTFFFLRVSNDPISSPLQLLLVLLILILLIPITKMFGTSQQVEHVPTMDKTCVRLAPVGGQKINTTAPPLPIVEGIFWLKLRVFFAGGNTRILRSSFRCVTRRPSKFSLWSGFEKRNGGQAYILPNTWHCVLPRNQPIGIPPKREQHNSAFQGHVHKFASYQDLSIRLHVLTEKQGRILVT